MMSGMMVGLHVVRVAFSLSKYGGGNSTVRIFPAVFVTKEK